VFVDGVGKAADGLAAFDSGVVDRGFTSLGAAGLGVGRVFEGVDLRGVDRMVDTVGETAVRLSGRLRKLQSGLVANYALFMLLFGIGIFYVIFYFSRLGDR
jgi:hypothetical protein